MWIVISLIVLGIVFGVWRGMKGPAYNLERLETAISALLRRGFDYGFLVIKISYSIKFIQFRKYINAPGDYGIQFGFPKAKWSRPYFDDVFRICREIDSGSYIIDADGIDFIYVEFKRDVKKAHLCAKRVLTEVFGVTDETKLFVTLEDAALWDDGVIDDPDKYPDESLKETTKRTGELIRKAYRGKREGKGSDKEP